MNDIQESVMEAGVSIGTREHDAQFSRVLSQAFYANLNVIYTVVPRAGTTYMLRQMIDRRVFGNHVLMYAGGMLHAFEEGKVVEYVNERHPSNASAAFKDAPLIIDQPHLCDDQMLLVKRLRCHQGPIFLFTDRTCELLQSIIVQRPTIFAHDLHVDALRASPFPIITYNDASTSGMVPVPRRSYLEGYLLRILRLRASDAARAAYLMHVLTRIFTAREVSGVILCHPELLNDSFIVRSLDDALRNGRGVCCNRSQDVADIMAKCVPEIINLYDTVVHDLQSYVSEI
jgi:hypothetical protein